MILIFCLLCKPCKNALKKHDKIITSREVGHKASSRRRQRIELFAASLFNTRTRRKYPAPGGAGTSWSGQMQPGSGAAALQPCVLPVLMCFRLVPWRWAGVVPLHWCCIGVVAQCPNAIRKIGIITFFSYIFITLPRPSGCEVMWSNVSQATQESHSQLCIPFNFYPKNRTAIEDGKVSPYVRSMKRWDMMRWDETYPFVRP